MNLSCLVLSLVIFLHYSESVKGFASIRIKFSPIRSAQLHQIPENTESSITDEELQMMRNSDLESLLKQLETRDMENLDPRIADIVNDKIKENGLSDWEVRKQILGINGFTIGGFILAIILLSLNAIFGAGWLGNLFGMNEASKVPEKVFLFQENGQENLQKLDLPTQQKLLELRQNSVINYEDIIKRIETNRNSE
jgi:hypothetical protein